MLLVCSSNPPAALKCRPLHGHRAAFSALASNTGSVSANPRNALQMLEAEENGIDEQPTGHPAGHYTLTVRS